MPGKQQLRVTDSWHILCLRKPSDLLFKIQQPKVINQSHLENLKSLKYFDIYWNKLQCSCDNAWFKNWSINTANVHTPYLQSYTCQQPNIKNLLIDLMILCVLLIWKNLLLLLLQSDPYNHDLLLVH